MILPNSYRFYYKPIEAPTLGKQKTDHLCIGNLFSCKMWEKTSKVLVN